MSDGPDVPGPSTCERCGRPTAAAPIDLLDGTRYYCTPCLALVVNQQLREVHR
jgi:hypothetical protein